MKERINFKILNQAAWISLLLTFITPYELSSSGFKTQGYPVKYFTTLLFSTSTNLLGLISNILVIYIMINTFILLKERLKKYKS